MAIIQPWAIDGATLTGAQARTVTFKATSGARGVTLPDDLKVLALNTPGGAVRVQPGGATLPNDYLDNGGGQSYGTLILVEEEVPVPKTTSSGARVSYMIQRIEDPEYGGQVPEDPTTHRYDPFVLVSSLSGINYPWVPLAKITQPASRADIQQDMIEDIREVANPITSTVIRARALLGSEDETLGATKEDGEWFPNIGGEQKIFIPESATNMIIEADWMQIREPGGNAWGECWVEWGPYLRPSTRKYATQRFGWNTSQGNDVERGAWGVAGDYHVRKEFRGTVQPFIMKARLIGKTNNASRPNLDGWSGVRLRITFQQIADKSTT